MSQEQATLERFDAGALANPGVPRQSESEKPRLGFADPPSLPDLPADVKAARNADWVVFTGRYPYVFDAARFGYAVGYREDKSYQWLPGEVDLPVHFLDNDYRNADLDRFVERAIEAQPELAVVGDIYDVEDLPQHLDAIEEITAAVPHCTPILVPKCSEVLDEIPAHIVIGYPNGKSDITGRDIAPIERWRSLENRLHILGGPPLRTATVIEDLTKETLTGAPPSDIAGLDSNRVFRAASKYGDYLAADGGWRENMRDTYAPTRELLLYSLVNTRQFWISRGVWPGATAEALASRDALEGAVFDRELDLRGGQVIETAELFNSPLPSIDPVDLPLLRTDESNATIIEPLSQLSRFTGHSEWQPDGSLMQSTACSYEGIVEPVCPGCGSHLPVEAETASQRSQTETRIAAYEHQFPEESTSHCESVPKQGDETLELPKSYPDIFWFCSELCQSRVEREPGALLGPFEDSTGWPEPLTLGTVSIQRQDPDSPAY